MKIIKKIRKMLKKWGVLVLLALVLVLVVSIYNVKAQILPAKTENGFDEFGYNRTARNFNGTGLSWCLAKGLTKEWCNNYLGSSVNDKLIMKWNAEWDRGNAENWSKPPYSAWTDNEWNGMVKGGSGSVWHYKIAWDETCAKGGTPSAGGYCIWGQFKVLMDQGKDATGHFILDKSTPAGYGSH